MYSARRSWNSRFFSATRMEFELNEGAPETQFAEGKEVEEKKGIKGAIRQKGNRANIRKKER